MIDLVIRFLTPLVCGYLVFVMLSNRFLPWPRPSALLSRPRWLLGCCCGAAVAACLLLVMHFSYGKSTQEFLVVAPPLGIIFLTLITGAVLAWLGYRKRCIDHARDDAAYVDAGLEPGLETQLEPNLGLNLEPKLETQPGKIDSEENDQQILHAAAKNPAQDNGEADTKRLAVQSFDREAYDLAFDAAYIRTLQARNADNTRPLGQAEQEFLQQAQQLAKQQYEIRCEVEKNLRITRKALLKLESEQHREQAGKSENELLLEGKLLEQIRTTTKAENRLLREVDRSGQLQSRLAVSKDLVAQAKAEVRSNMEARANAILTARKSVNFAKRSLEARDRAERKHENLKIQLDIQSQTTSKVIKALELEKQKTREQSSLLALQGEQAQGLRKIQNSKPNKPWLSRVTRGKTDKGRIIRKVAERASEATDSAAQEPLDVAKLDSSRKTTEA